MPCAQPFASPLPRPAASGRRAGARSHGVHSILREFLAWLVRCAERSIERRILAQLTDWQLQDIGISRAEADAEAGKWFWRP